jgi:lipoate-protein ligase A
MSKVVKLLRLRQVPILQQLRLEEALLRVDKHNWLIVNDGTPETAVVMGISGYEAQRISYKDLIDASA